MGRTRLDAVSQSHLIETSNVIVVAKFIESEIVRHPQEDKGDVEYPLQCCHFEITDILYLDNGMKKDKNFNVDVSVGAKILVAPSDSRMYHSGFVHHKKTGGYRSFAVSVYNSLSSKGNLKVGKSYIVYARRCSLNSDLLEFSADKSWDSVKELESIRKQIEAPPSRAVRVPPPPVPVSTPASSSPPQ
eukprot:TRINITY_DN1926_c0_g1_i2.p1 TRINITY_DN1926_c0_g1~~TRINITY_DN1926_c0_g1_i2.p1  ORF type:complete len:188 (-),score=18.04 TRINITY_DN1926_c0_g1_i2:37-600(-)